MTLKEAIRHAESKAKTCEWLASNQKIEAVADCERKCGEEHRQLAEWLRELQRYQWIPCSERLPKVNQNVLLCTNDGKVFLGHRDKPELIWQVTEEDGRKHWVYDPENYTADVDGLPKAEDCAFDKDEYYADGYLSVTSMNYDERFVGIIAWMPLPKPWKGADDED